MVANQDKVVLVIRINVKNLITLNLPRDSVWFEFRELGLALRRIGGQDPEAGGGKKLFRRVVFGSLDRGTTGQESGGQGKRE